MKIKKITVGRSAGEKFQHGQFGGNDYDNSERSAYNTWELEGEWTEAEAIKVGNQLSKKLSDLSVEQVKASVKKREEEIRERYVDKRKKLEEDLS